MSNQARSSDLTFVVISLGEASLVVSLADRLRSAEVLFKVFMDDRTSRSELQVLDDAGVDYSLVKNPRNFVEAVFPIVADRVSTSWAWFLDTDELPSLAAIEMVSRAVDSARSFVNAIGVPRVWVRREMDGRLFRSRAAFIGRDIKWRVVKIQSVNFTPIIHSHGHRLIGWRSRCLEDRAVVYHLDWIVHSRDARLEKLELYESELPGAQAHFRDWYLPEANPGLHNFEPISDSWLADYVESIVGYHASSSWASRLTKKDEDA